MAPEAGAYMPEALKTNSSTHSGLSTPSQSSTSTQAPLSKSPMASAPSRVDPSGPTPVSTASAEQVAWSQWYETARESPDVTVRLQALEQWAQRPDDALDPVTYGLVDQDEAVRNRAQVLYEQALARAATAPVQSSQQGAPESAAEQ